MAELAMLVDRLLVSELEDQYSPRSPWPKMQRVNLMVWVLNLPVSLTSLLFVLYRVVHL